MQPGRATPAHGAWISVFFLPNLIILPIGVMHSHVAYGPQYRLPLPGRKVI